MRGSRTRTDSSGDPQRTHRRAGHATDTQTKEGGGEHTGSSTAGSPRTLEVDLRHLVLADNLLQPRQLSGGGARGRVRVLTSPHTGSDTSATAREVTPQRRRNDATAVSVEAEKRGRRGTHAEPRLFEGTPHAAHTQPTANARPCTYRNRGLLLHLRQQFLRSSNNGHADRRGGSPTAAAGL